MTDKTEKQHDLGVLEEDDEFEEFPAEDWKAVDEAKGDDVWEEKWEDDNIEVTFRKLYPTHERCRYLKIESTIVS